MLLFHNFLNSGDSGWMTQDHGCQKFRKRTLEIRRGLLHMIQQRLMKFIVQGIFWQNENFIAKIIFNWQNVFFSGSRQLLVGKHSVLGRKVEVSQQKIHGSLLGNSSPISIKWTSKPPKSYCQFTKRFGCHYQRNEEFCS